jgi:hypothetical protein
MRKRPCSGFSVTAGRPVVVWVTPDCFCRKPYLPSVARRRIDCPAQQKESSSANESVVTPDWVIVRDRTTIVAERAKVVEQLGAHGAILHAGHQLCFEEYSTGVRRLHMPWRVFRKSIHEPEMRAALAQFEVLGTSVHSVSEALFAAETGLVSYLLVGTMFATASHPEKSSPEFIEGIPLMRAVSQALSTSSLHLYGIGGITPGNINQVLEAGAHGVATIRSIVPVLEYVACKYENHSV